MIMNKNSISKEQFKKLKGYVSNGQYEDIDEFFKNFITNQKNKQDLLQEIKNESFFFSFRLESMNKIDYLKASKNRYHAIFKHFSTSEQLILIHSMLLDWSKDYMDIIKGLGTPFLEPWGEKNKNNDISKREALILAAKFLFKKDYDGFLLLKEKVPNLFDLNSTVAPIYYGNKHSTGCIYVYADKNFYTIKDSLILNFDQENIGFFKSNNFELEKDIKNITKLEETIESLIEKNNYLRFQTDYNLKSNINNYRNLVLSDILNRKLNKKENPKTSIFKI